MLKCINIDLKFNGNYIFKDFNLDLPKGVKAAIVGNSGRGKSTLFNMILGFVEPDKGSIFVDNIELNPQNISIIRQKISWLPQNPSIIGNGKVRDEINYILSFEANKGIKEFDIEEEFEKLNLDRKLLESYFTELSGGEKQRIGIIISKILDRDLILMDEPTSALDERNIGSVFDYIVSLKDKTILSASHDKNWLRYCDKIINI